MIEKRKRKRFCGTTIRGFGEIVSDFLNKKLRKKENIVRPSCNGVVGGNSSLCAKLLTEAKTT